MYVCFLHKRLSLCLNLFLKVYNLYAYTYAYISMSKPLSTYLSIYLHVYLSIYLHTHTHIEVYVCVCACVHASMQTRRRRRTGCLHVLQRNRGMLVHAPSAMLVHCMHTCLIAQSCAACRWTELGIHQRQEVACLSAQPGMASSSEAPKPEEAFGFAVSRVLQLQQRTRTHQHSCLRFRGARPSTRNRRRYPNPAKHSRATKCRAVAVGS